MIADGKRKNPKRRRYVAFESFRLRAAHSKWLRLRAGAVGVYTDAWWDFRGELEALRSRSWTTLREV